MIKSQYESSPLFSSLLRAVGFKVRHNRSNRNLYLLGVSGTIGRGEIQHCDTWDIETDLPPAIQSSRDFGALARRRREEAPVSLQRERSDSYSDAFGNR